MKPKTPVKPQSKPKPEPKQNKPKSETGEFDAARKVLGRLATESANCLRGKKKPSFRPNLLMGEKVVVNNASKMIVTGNKIEQKVYQRHTGYLGHLKTVTLKEIMQKNPGDALKRAVYGMLPKNKLRDTWMHNLEIHN